MLVERTMRRHNMDTDKIMTLRGQGYSVREIAHITGISKSTIHRSIKEVEMENNTGSNTSDDVDGQLVHLNFTFSCPNCGKEQNHVWLCSYCGKFIPMDCDNEKCCPEGFDMSQVKLRRLPTH
jgi:hypothetical protein